MKIRDANMPKRSRTDILLGDLNKAIEAGGPPTPAMPPPGQQPPPGQPPAPSGQQPGMNLPPQLQEAMLSALTKVINEGDAPERIERMDKDPEMKKEIEQLKNDAELNKVMADEALAMLFDDELGYIWGTDGTYRYIDFELEPVFNCDLLRRAGKTEPARLIKNKRSLQLMDFAKPVAAKYNATDTGLALTFKDPNYQATKEEKIELSRFSTLLTEKFFYPPLEREPDFAGFLKVCYEDWFDLDDITVETRRTLDGTPLSFHLCDPKYIKPIMPRLANFGRWDQDILEATVMDPERAHDVVSPQSIEYSYIFQKKMKRYMKYQDDRMYKAHFFHASDFRRAKRGFGVMEQSIRIITYILNAFTLNSSNFTVNRTPQGMLALTGGTTNIVQLEKFKKLLSTYHTGAQNRNRFPVLGMPEKGDAKWVPFRDSSKEMEYHLWVTLLMTLLCELSGTNPEELGVASHREAMQSGKLGKDGATQVMEQSKDVGLRMFLGHIENMLNRSSYEGKNVWEQILNKPVKVKFIGLEMKNEKLEVEIDKGRLAIDKSVNDFLLAKDQEAEELIFGGKNLYDVKALALPQVFTALNTLQQQQFQKEQAAQQMAQQQAAATAQNAPAGPQPEYSDKDKELIDQYGEPEQAGQDENAAHAGAMQEEGEPEPVPAEAPE